MYVQNASLTENIVQKWGGAAIVATASSSMVIDSNNFLELGGAAAGAENAIMIETTSALGNTFTITKPTKNNNPEIGIKNALTVANSFIQLAFIVASSMVSCDFITRLGCCYCIHSQGNYHTYLCKLTDKV